MSSSCSSDDHLCSSQRPLDQSAQHSASGGRSFSSWPTLLGGKPLQVNVSHSQGQLQCDKSVCPASSWVPDLRQAPPPLSVPPDHLGGLSGLPLAPALGLTRASLGWQLSRSSSGPRHALPLSVRTMQTPPLRHPLRVVGVCGVPRSPGTSLPVSMGWAPCIGALPSDGFPLPVSLPLGPLVDGVPFAGRGRGASGTTPKSGAGSCQPGLDGWSTGFPSLDPHQQRGGSAV